MTVIVRDFQPPDAEAWTRVRRTSVPYLVSTPEQVTHDLAHAHPDRHYRLLVAERDGEIIGTAQAGIAHEGTEPGQGFCTPHVLPGHTGHGAGSLLLSTAEEHLAQAGATVVHAWVLDRPESLEFARGRGYRPGRSAHFQHLDLAGGALPPLQEVPAGVELRPGSDFADDPRPLFDADAQVTLDEPTDIPTEPADYEDWLATVWRHPTFDAALTTVALVDGRVAAFSAAGTDGDRTYSSNMTGTLRAFRGRGLAKLAKNDSLHRARAAGYTDAFTANDTGNGPMLAINKWFGYTVCATEVRHARTLG
ncbi:GNAT family N-acetyltransferase [Streptomyces cyaneofuscatus]|uniref:GNAT family N-acetyltransferase n=1 Tax=Streptomyces cyaneofuscatus TaxID=66883 RepID=UPI0013DC3D1A|nr:GNAT family N-acetyltransferase [Streptomyces cyaneofuscatus]NDZ67889.1 GNAT family N-acetyltransferase [Streptomyces cyaneofuscatus]